MAIGDIEYPLKRGDRLRLECWAAAWMDFLQAGQMLHLAVEADQRRDWAPALFPKYALIDDAVITYMRSFTSGRRRGIVDLKPWIDDLGAETQELHERAARWRDKHIAHHDDETAAHMTLTLLWGQFGTTQPGLRVRYERSLGPDDDFARDLLALCELLRNWIWERELWPQQDAWLRELGHDAVDGMRRKARPHADQTNVINALRVTQDIGSERPKPTPPYRSLPSKRRARKKP